MTSPSPSTNWTERFLPDEGALFDAFAAEIGAIATRISATTGPGRAFHRVGVAGLRGRLEILPDLPPHAAQGVCAAARGFDVEIRLSNGAVAPQPDHAPDIRGFALKILGVEGPGALGSDTTCQDFLFINREVFGFKDAAPFIEIAKAASVSPFALLMHMMRTHGFFAGLGETRKLVGSLSRPFSGFLSELMFTAVPVAWGPYAARLRLRPEATGLPFPKSRQWIDDVKAQLARGPVSFTLEAQFFLDETRTPIEDASQVWDAPWEPLARLVLPPQEVEPPTPTSWVEQAKFDPWQALLVHRPLGQIMRARKAAYFVSQKARAV